jgi:hypothetical protein
VRVEGEEAGVGAGINSQTGTSGTHSRHTRCEGEGDDAEH